MIVDPLVSIAIGISLFSDQVQTSGVRGPGEAVALLVLCAGAFSLARSPLVATVHSEDEHLLSRRRLNPREPASVCPQA